MKVAGAKNGSLLAAFDAAGLPYAQAARELVELKSQDRANEALDKLNGPATTTFQKADDLLSDLVDFNVQLGERANAEGVALVAQSKTGSLAWVVLAVLVSVSGALVIGRSITRPLGGEPATVIHVAESIAAGDLGVAIPVRPGDTTSAIARLATMQAGLVRIVAGVRRDAEGVAVATSQIAQGNQDLASRTESQASAIEETASSMQQLAPAPDRTPTAPRRPTAWR